MAMRKMIMSQTVSDPFSTRKILRSADQERHIPCRYYLMALELKCVLPAT